MKKSIIAVILFLLSVSSPALSQTVQQQETKKPIQTITLKDGSMIKGALLDVEGDFYVIQTKNMGIIKIRSNDVIRIVIEDNPSPPASFQAEYPQQMNQLQQKLLADPEIINSIQELMQDEEIKNLLQDKNLQDDVSSMDPSKIQDNQAIQNLLKHPKMQEIINKAGQKLNIQPPDTSE